MKTSFGFSEIYSIIDKNYNYFLFRFAKFKLLTNPEYNGLEDTLSNKPKIGKVKQNGRNENNFCLFDNFLPHVSRTFGRRNGWNNCLQHNLKSSKGRNRLGGIKYLLDKQSVEDEKKTKKQYFTVFNRLNELD